MNTHYEIPPPDIINVFVETQITVANPFRASVLVPVVVVPTTYIVTPELKIDIVPDEAL